MFFSDLSCHVFSLFVSHSPPLPLQDVVQHWAGLQTWCRGSSDFNLVLPLCVLASNVHSCQSKCIFFWGKSYCPFINSMDRVCLVGHVNSICSSYRQQEGVGPLLSKGPCPWVSIVVLSLPLHMSYLQKFALEATLEDLGLPQG